MKRLVIIGAMRGAILGGEKKWILLVSGCTFACRKRMKKQIYL